ncbi:cytochrome c oxidase subunit NDUFA4 [Pogona vitticeps]|uniref:Cytochrome c oxidase subunit NDUFA4-like n=1 Tax=Pogona vitticeps TaxID=103695 RepID=A0A6J0UCI9_9SAUR|nr:cytochrome c oxidase subunit NDUFA4-like [Pogona vitticeps]
MFNFISAQLKRTPSLLPLFVLLGVTVSGSLMFLFRVGARCPDYTWSKKENPEPWNKLPPTYQYKMVTIQTDYSKLKKDRPDF